MTKKPTGLPSKTMGFLARLFNERVKKEFTVPVRSLGTNESAKKKGQVIRVLKFADANEFAHFVRSNPQKPGEYYDLRDRDLRNVNLDGADLRYADLSRSRLEAASLYNTVLAGATMDRCMAERTYFVEVDLSGVRMRDCKLSSARFENSDVSGADFSFSQLSSARFENVKGRKCVFANANLQWGQMVDSDFVGANLDQAQTSGLNMSGSDFTQARISMRQVDQAANAPDHWNKVTAPVTKLHKDSSQASRLRRIRKNNGKFF